MASNNNDDGGVGCLGMLLGLAALVWVIKMICYILAGIFLIAVGIVLIVLACIAIYVAALALWELARFLFNASMKGLSHIAGVVARIVAAVALVIDWFNGHDVPRTSDPDARDGRFSTRTLNEGDAGPVFSGTVEDGAWLHATQCREDQLPAEGPSGWQSVSPHHNLKQRRVWSIR